MTPGQWPAACPAAASRVRISVARAAASRAVARGLARRLSGPAHTHPVVGAPRGGPGGPASLRARPYSHWNGPGHAPAQIQLHCADPMTPRPMRAMLRPCAAAQPLRNDTAPLCGPDARPCGAAAARVDRGLMEGRVAILHSPQRARLGYEAAPIAVRRLRSESA